MDKIIKLLIHKRKGAKTALSLKRDDFGSTTASARSLGSSELPFFDWPRFNSEDEAIKALSSLPTESILGFFLDGSPSDAKSDSLKALVKECRSKGIPVIADQTSALFKNDQELMFEDTLEADICYFYAGFQLGVIACSRDFFLEQPLMMISTWDGDEFSLDRLRDRILGI